MKNLKFCAVIVLIFMPFVACAGVKIFWQDNAMALKAKEIIALSKQKNSPVAHIHYNGIDEYTYDCPETKNMHRIQLNSKKKSITIGEGCVIDLKEIRADFMARKLSYLPDTDFSLLNQGETITQTEDSIVLKLWGKAGHKKKAWASLTMPLAKYDAVLSSWCEVVMPDKSKFSPMHSKFSHETKQESRELKEDTSDICVFIGKVSDSITPTVSQTKEKGIANIIENGTKSGHTEGKPIILEAGGHSGQNIVIYHCPTQAPSLGKIPFLGVIKRSGRIGTNPASRPTFISAHQETIQGVTFKHRFETVKMPTRKEAYNILRSEPNRD